MGKTVTTYLIDGDPKGTQYVFISNKICQMYVIPRSNLSILNERQELQTPAFYILLGEDEATILAKGVAVYLERCCYDKG